MDGAAQRLSIRGVIAIDRPSTHTALGSEHPAEALFHCGTEAGVFNLGAFPFIREHPRIAILAQTIVMWWFCQDPCATRPALPFTCIRLAAANIIDYV